MSRRKFIGDYPLGTKLSVRVLPRDINSNWNEKQVAWLKAHSRKLVTGRTLDHEGAYFRPKGCRFLILTDDEIVIKEVVK